MGQRKKKKKKGLKPQGWILLFLAAMPLVILGGVHWIGLQSAMSALWWAMSHPSAFLLEYVLLLAVCGLLYGLTGRLWPSALLPGTVLLLVALISHYKTVINGTPLLLSDFTLAAQALEIAEFALPQLTLTPAVLLSAAGFLAVCVLLFLLDRFVEGKKAFRLAVAIPSGLCLLAVAVTPLFTGWAVSLEKEPLSQEERIAEYGAVLGLYATYAQDRAEAARYTGSAVRRLESQVEALEDPVPQEDRETPTVIFLMSESFFDVTRLPQVTFSQDPIPVFHSLAREHTSGSFLSSMYCGGTGYVEMEVLTGICGSLLKESETITSLTPEEVYDGIPVITDALEPLGYRTAFLHAYNAELYNRQAIYSRFGFDQILFEDSFPADAERKGGYLSDMALSREIISLYEESEEPLFLFAVSMENHQPYTAEKYGTPDQVTLSSSHLSGQELAVLEAYTQGLTDADAALGCLVDYFSGREEPVMLVFFGDHLPNLGIGQEETIYSRLGYSSSAVTTDWQPEELARMLSTDYLIWTNYETEAAPDRTESCTTLGLSVLDRLGVPLPDYYAWMQEYVTPSMLLWRPRLYVDAQGTCYGEIPGEHRQVMEDYQVAVYDIVYGDRRVFPK